MIIRAADLLAEARRVNTMAGTAAVRPDYTIVAERIRNEATCDWNDQIAVDRFIKRGGTFVRGRGVLDGPGRVVVGDEAYQASTAVILATGTSPAIPPIPGLADAKPWTNRDIFKVREGSAIHGRHRRWCGRIGACSGVLPVWGDNHGHRGARPDSRTRGAGEQRAGCQGPAW